MYADGEVIFRGCLTQLIEDRLDHGWGELFAGQTITTAYYLGQLLEPVGHKSLRQDGHNILIERLATGTGFFGAIEHGNMSDRRW